MFKRNPFIRIKEIFSKKEKPPTPPPLPSRGLPKSGFDPSTPPPPLVVPLPSSEPSTNAPAPPELDDIKAPLEEAPSPPEEPVTKVEVQSDGRAAAIPPPPTTPPPPPPTTSPPPPPLPPRQKKEPKPLTPEQLAIVEEGNKEMARIVEENKGRYIPPPLSKKEGSGNVVAAQLNALKEAQTGDREPTPAPTRGRAQQAFYEAQQAKLGQRKVVRPIERRVDAVVANIDITPEEAFKLAGGNAKPVIKPTTAPMAVKGESPKKSGAVSESRNLFGFMHRKRPEAQQPSAPAVEEKKPEGFTPN